MCVNCIQMSKPSGLQARPKCNISLIQERCVCVHAYFHISHSSKYHIYQPLRLGRIWHKVNFLVEFNRFEFSFPSPWLVASPRLKNLVCPTILPITGGRIIGFIPFPMGISAMWNAISLVQDLNSCRRVHFLRR